jgi:hypothetical protein
VAVSRSEYLPGMRRFIDFVLIVLVLAAVGFGAYYIGHRVDHESTSLSSQDSELGGTTVAATRTKSDNKHRTEIIVGAALGGTAVLILLGSLTGTLLRSRKRDYWRAS